MELSDSYPSTSTSQVRFSIPIEVPGIKVESQDDEESGIQFEEIQINREKVCCTLYQWSGKHQRCCKNHPQNRRNIGDISIVWFYFVLLMLFLCLFFVIFLGVVKNY
ncbi:uncharacterized protein CELE_M03B6.5 [Caenorhabditis elegans]|uniref:Transmembrane protein n=1 Tax=Caenorhabditis elegans TaxID=6239 RepID=Q7YWZ5_CAEEL|nr:Transmembrane protein [Caenorhabditis elegans]CAE17854.1 Transmembrane protein [Caenorhabditis elegans]|eukprot:NP_001024802.1 Uncharacterized protein CELE_M03B6.5 [Caenorhabditis elegans]